MEYTISEQLDPHPRYPVVTIKGHNLREGDLLTYHTIYGPSLYVTDVSGDQVTLLAEFDTDQRFTSPGTVFTKQKI